MELLETISTSRAMRHVKLNSHSHLRNRLEIAKLAKSFTNNKIPESFKSNVFLKSHFYSPNHVSLAKILSRAISF